MTFKASYFSVSIPLIKENLRRFWVIPALAFLAYFLSSVFPILMSYNHINDMYDYIGYCLTNQQPVFFTIHLFLPIITAVIVFRYMQSSSSVTTMHAMPFTRSQLFNSNVLSGLILIISPLLANEILLQVIAKPTYDYYMYVDGDNLASLLPSAENIFNRPDILTWFWQSLLIVVVLYAVSVFAGMVTGNVVMHLAMAISLNFLVPSLYTVFIVYCSDFLFGFSSEGIHENFLCASSPLLQVLANQFTEDTVSFPLLIQLFYILLTLVILVLSSFLYQKRALEKVGDSMVFRFMVPTICYLIAFFGMSLMGYYFTILESSHNDMKDNHLYFYGGLIAGAVIFFIIGRMIVLKTPRVFNKSSIKNFCIYAVLATLFVTTITFDLTGFEQRVPNINKVSGIYFSGNTFSDKWFLDQPSYFKHTGKMVKNDTLCYSDPKTMEAIAGFHRDIIENKDEILEKSRTGYRFTRSSEVSLDYQTGSKFDFQRTYSMPLDFFNNNKYLKQIYESAEYKNFFSFNNLNCDKFSEIIFSNIYYYNDTNASKLLITEASKMSALVEAMEKDFQERTFEEYTNPVHPYCTVSLEYQYKNENNRAVNMRAEVSILKSDKHTIAWIEENGYNAYLECTAEKVNRIILTEFNEEKDAKLTKEQAVTTAEYATSEAYVEKYGQSGITESGIDENGRRVLVITDENQIQEILDTFSTTPVSSDNYFEGSIVFKNSDANNNSVVSNIYFDTTTAPKFMLDYFN